MNLAEEAAAVGAAFDIHVGDTTNKEVFVNLAATRLIRDDSAPAHLVSDLDLATKWGLPEVLASEGGKVTGSSRSTKPQRLETSVDDSAAPRLEPSSPLAVDGSAAHLEFANGTMAAFDLSSSTIPEEMNGKATDLDFTPTMAVNQTSEWTVVTNKYGGSDVEGARNNFPSASSQFPVLKIEQKFFPTWFDLSNEEDTLGPIPEDWIVSTVTPTAPTLPKLEPMDFSIMEGILDDVSDDKATLAMRSDLYSQLSVQGDEDANMQAAIMNSCKDPKAMSLGAGWRAGYSKLQFVR
ncbi:hypothetical protein K438DRAFT_1974528 [Mycena galopus ATCC 62051]|nr:hypothetical protein K438DRAFT_1974528 [Mycena galopus ATCC 62051]